MSESNKYAATKDHEVNKRVGENHVIEKDVLDRVSERFVALI